MKIRGSLSKNEMMAEFIEEDSCSNNVIKLNSHLNTLLHVESLGKRQKLTSESLTGVVPTNNAGIFTTTASFLIKTQQMFTLQHLLESTWALVFHK